MNWSNSLTGAVIMAAIVLCVLVYMFYGNSFSVKKIKPIRLLRLKKNWKKSFPADIEVSNELKEAVGSMLAVWESPADAKLPERMDKTFRKQSEKAQKLMAGNGICRKMNLIDIELNPGETGRKKEFIRRNDGGREWRETTIKAGVLEKYEDSASGRTIRKTYYPDGILILRQSRHIGAGVKGEKEYHKETKTICPSCGAEISLDSQYTTCPYCGGHMVSRFFDWQTERFDFKGNQRDTKPEYIAVATAAVFVIALLLFRIMNGWVGPSILSLMGAFFVLTAFFLFFRTLPIYREEDCLKEIVRYSESYLISCINEYFWQNEDSSDVVDFVIGDITMKNVENTDDTTEIEIIFPAVKKLLQGGRINTDKHKYTMKLKRARYPERMKSKGKATYEKECPSCGANFTPDENGYCSYCGYGLRTENYKWKVTYVNKK